ncbi:MAG: prepilin-type N-terminal cleavage/methylation domain-containing protein [Planctomycetota bacterium]|nr:prepilin-type N-terminal cleavage/methylation domain-containing protein [Planctomycetota bacterium]
MTCNRASSRTSARAFTLVEMLVVLTIILLLAGVAAPVFSAFAKSSTLDQATKVVFSALRQARVTAINDRRVTAVMYGDDLAGIEPKPLAGVLPSRNQIEVWTVLDAGHFSYPYMPDLPSAQHWTSPWYPYRFKDVPVTPEPMTIPEGARVIAGLYDKNTANFHFGGGGWTCYKKDSIGEILRHQTVFDPTGCKPLHGGYGGFDHVLVFVPSTGALAVIQTSASWYNGYFRPRVVSQRLDRVGGLALTRPQDLAARIDGHPGTN